MDPTCLNAACQHWGVLLMRRRMVSWGISSQIWTRASLRSWIVWGATWWRWMVRNIMSQRCSIGFVSGELGGPFNGIDSFIFSSIPSASLPDELNTFYARFEADNTAHTENAPAPAAAAEEVSPLSLSVADVTRSFKRVNIRKAVGPDGIPGRVLKACAAFQLARHFQSVPLSVCGSLMLQKIHHCAHTEEK